MQNLKRCRRAFISLSLATLLLPVILVAEEGEKKQPRIRAQVLQKIPRVRALRQPDFGPLEDGKEASHQKLVKEGWIYLFDSRILQDENVKKRHQIDPLILWRTRNPDNPKRNHWSAVEEDGQLVLKNTIGRGAHGTDLISRQDFWDFDLHVELRAHSNSGIYLRGRYEIQVNNTPPDREKPSAGELGGIYGTSAPLMNAGKDPKEWQTIDASIRGYKISVWLNGKQIQKDVDLEEKEKLGGTGSQLGTGDGLHASDPESPGPIFLQGDHGSVDFRNIRIRPAPSMPRVLVPVKPLKLHQPEKVKKLIQE